MKKRCLLLVTVLLLAALLPACAASSDSSGGSSSASSTGAAYDRIEAPMAMEESAASSAPQMGLDFSASNSGTTRTYAGADAKLIQRAEVTLQTTDFTAAEEALNALVEAQGGYYESARVQGGDYYDQSAARYGSYVVRVPKERYESFLASVGGLGHLVSLNRSSDDVGEAYFDTEARLRTQETKRDRLQALLEKAENMEDIISLETALSEVEYQIEQYSTELRRYDSLVDYATISISLDEVIRVTDAAGPADSLGTRMSAALSDGLASAGESLGNFAVWCAYNLVGLLIVAVIIIVGVVILVRWRRKKRAPPPAPPAAEDKK